MDCPKAYLDGPIRILCSGGYANHTQPGYVSGGLMIIGGIVDL